MGESKPLTEVIEQRRERLYKEHIRLETLIETTSDIELKNTYSWYYDIYSELVTIYDCVLVLTLKTKEIDARNNELTEKMDDLLNSATGVMTEGLVGAVRNELKEHMKKYHILSGEK